MNAATLKALKESIAHWKRMRAKPSIIERPISDDCPLCRLFFKDELLTHCAGCPVMDKTDKSGCVGTPYDDAYEAWHSLDLPNTYDYPPSWIVIVLSTWRRLALLEIKFLQSLLPVKRKKS